MAFTSFSDITKNIKKNFSDALAYRPKPKSPVIPGQTPAPIMTPAPQNMSTPSGATFAPPPTTTMTKPVIPQIKQEPTTTITPPIVKPKFTGTTPPPPSIASFAAPTLPAPIPPSPTAMPPAPPSAAVNAAAEAEAAYKKALEISPEEFSTQEDIDNFMESFRKGQANIQRPIVAEIGQGQLAELGRQAQLVVEPLERKLARIQSARQASLEASKFALDRSDKRVSDEQSVAEKVRAEAESARRFGIEQAGSAESRTIQRESLEQTKTIADRQFEEDKRRFGLDYALRQKELTMKNTPSAKDAAAEAKANDAKVSQAQDALDAINQLAQHPGKGSAVGASFSKFWRGATPFTSDQPFAGTDRADFLTLLDQTKARLSLDNLSALKGLGAMSDREFATIQAASAALRPEMSEEEFNKQIGLIQQSLASTIKAGSVSGEKNTEAANQYQLSDGTIVTRQPDGTYK